MTWNAKEARKSSMVFRNSDLKVGSRSRSMNGSLEDYSSWVMKSKSFWGMKFSRSGFTVSTSQFSQLVPPQGKALIALLTLKIKVS